MKVVLSLNSKFFGITADEFINILKENDKEKIIKGFEISIKDNPDKTFLKQIAHISRRDGYILRLHAPVLENVCEYKEYFDFVNSIVEIYGDDINVVFHPIGVTVNCEESIIETKRYLKEIYEYLNHRKYNGIIISIENLNDMVDYRRLKKNDLERILKEIDKLKFTYDIGHEIVENMLDTELSEILKERLNNIHIHINEGRDDHYPIIIMDEKKEENVQALDAIENIKEYGYDDIVVTEYSIDYIEGIDFISKLIRYIDYSIMLGKKLY